MDEEVEDSRSKCIMHAVGVSHAELTKMKKEKNNLKVNEWEERRWKTEVEERETLEI